jgi:signal transduction histidine kinase
VLSVGLGGDAKANEVAVEIRDTGVGIPAELVPRLFEPFASGKERGTGLGLAVSRRILQEHGGSIAARARTPRGSVFEVTLPVVAMRSRAIAGLA